MNSYKEDTRLQAPVSPETDTLTDQAREARRAYKREWNHKNKDKVKAAQVRYWNRKAREAAEAAGAQ